MVADAICDVTRQGELVLPLAEIQQWRLGSDGCDLGEPPIPRPCAVALFLETSAGGRWRCCQYNANSSPFVTALPYPGKLRP